MNSNLRDVEDDGKTHRWQVQAVWGCQRARGLITASVRSRRSFIHPLLSTDGHNIDIDAGELHYSECKEMLIECERDNTEMRRTISAQHGSRTLNATDQFVQSMDLDSLNIDDSANLVNVMMNRMIG